MENIRKMSSREINRLIGKIHFFDKDLYSQIDRRLAELLKVTSMLEEVNDETITAYLHQKKGAILNDVLCQGIKSEYPDYPEMED